MCKHLFSMGRDGETGSWCLDCGEKVLEVDSRMCKDCKFFAYVGLELAYPSAICLKKLMGVLPDMHVTYMVEKGTCFEPKSVLDNE